MTAKNHTETVAKRHHEVAVDNLAMTMQVSREGVKTLYGIVLRRIDRTARIKQFIAPLVVKRVKELLRDTKQPCSFEGRRSGCRDL